MIQQNTAGRQIVFKRHDTGILPIRATSQETHETRSTEMKSTEYSSQGSPQKIDGASSVCGSSYVKEQKAFRELSYLDPTEEMNKRWLKLLQKKVPTIDLVDISAEVYPFNSHKRQFAPEYSHSSYLSMLRQEYAIGDYVKNPKCTLQMTDYTRQQMVMLMEDLTLLKEYKTETLYLAVSIADRYLVHIAVEG